MEHILELVSNPIVNSLNCHSYITGIIGTDRKRLGYMLADYLDIVSTKEESDLWCEFINEKLMFAETSEIYDQTNCFKYNKIKSQRGLKYFEFFHNYEYFIHLIKDNLLSGYYLCGWYDEFYVNFSKYYNAKHVKHDYLVYGFSDLKKKFMVAGYNDKGFYAMNEIDFIEFYNAVMSIDSENDMTFFKVKEKFNFKYPKDKVILCLTAYLNGENWNKSYYNDGLCIYGINVQKKVSRHLAKCEINNSFNHDMKCFALLKDHKNVLYNMCNFLYEKSIIDESVLHRSNVIKKKMDNLFLIFIKTELLSTENKINIFRKMSKNLDEISQLEKEYLPNLVNAVEKLTDDAII